MRLWSYITWNKNQEWCLFDYSKAKNKKCACLITQKRKTKNWGGKINEGNQNLKLFVILVHCKNEIFCFCVLFVVWGGVGSEFENFKYK